MLLASVSSYFKGEGKMPENVYSCEVHAELESSSQFIYHRMWTGNDLIIMLYYS